LPDCPEQILQSRLRSFWGDINFVHPFREGNGRTQLQYLKLLATKAGHLLDLSRVDTKRWIEASQVSHAADYDLMAQLIAEAIAE
jgi:cell filamentation protein